MWLSGRLPPITLELRSAWIIGVKNPEIYYTLEGEKNEHKCILTVSSLSVTGKIIINLTLIEP